MKKSNLYNYYRFSTIGNIRMNTETRIEHLKDKLLSDVFLEGRGLGNEIPFWIFDYPPEDEHLVRHSIKRIEEILKSNSINFIEIDLYELCLEIIDSKIKFEKVIEFEKKRGSDELLKKLRIILKQDTVKKVITRRLSVCGNVEVVFLTGIGKAWPMIRSHSILNNLQPVWGNTPLLAFYPGVYNNTELNLFGKFEDGNYYRAFRIINEEEA